MMKMGANNATFARSSDLAFDAMPIYGNIVTGKT
jgi:hypothetical protein